MTEAKRSSAEARSFFAVALSADIMELWRNSFDEASECLFLKDGG